MAATRTAARLLACSAFASLLLGGATGAVGAPNRGASGWNDRAQLYVDAPTDESELDVTLDFGAAGPPARATLEVPAGFQLYPDRPPGTFIGNAEVYAAAGGYGTSAVTTLDGEVVAAPVDGAAEAAAQSCSARKHIAIWQIDFSLLGQPVGLPIYVSAQDPPNAGVRLDFCAPTLAAPTGATAPALPIASISLALPELDPPTTHDDYVWSSIITPLAPDQHTALPDKAYELRAIVPVPNTLTLRGHYQPRSHLAILTGTLTANGKPRPNVTVLFIGLARKVTPGGIVYADFPAGSTKTDRHGRYSFHHTIRRTTGFIAIARNTESRCEGPSKAPAGCLNTTTASSRSDPVTISIPHR
jgi:hypothetical protein